ncbi:hypothetical protein ACEQ8H_002916 [Pleosporales sp. CAS-2024a]
MKVLVIGATGNFGLRLVPALLSHGHRVVAFVRSSSKLESLLPETLHRQVQVVEGSAKESTAIANAILDHGCDAVVNMAGLSAIAPWSHTDFPAIFRSVVAGMREAGEKRGAPLRAWFLGGHLPVFHEHRENHDLLTSLPSTAMEWSMLAPSQMTAESEMPTTTTKAKLVANAETPPHWKHSWLRFIPLIGAVLDISMNAMRYKTTLEQSADLIATDLETRESPWVGLRVGIIDPSQR